MSSIRTRTAQRLKEAFNKNLITKDSNFDTGYEKALEFEANLTNLVSYINYLERSFECIAYFCAGIGGSATAMFAGSETHISLLNELNLAEESCGKQFTEASATIKGFYQDIAELQKGVAEVKLMKTEREKLRLVYDHYSQKVANLTKVLEKKRSSNPMYVDNPKKVELMARNERKFKSATDNFQSISAKALALINQLIDSSYTKVAPILAKVISLQLSLFAKTSKELAVIREVPQGILDANKRRMIAIERERLEQASHQPEPARLSLERNSMPASIKSPVQARPASMQPQAVESEEDCVFDMKKLDDLDKLSGTRSMSTWENSAQPVQSRSSYWDKPAGNEYSSEPAESPTYNHFATGMPRQSAPSTPMGRSASVAQLNTGYAQESPYVDPNQMAQMQQWMSMMMANPETVAQMQKMQQHMMSPPKPQLDPSDPFYALETGEADHASNDPFRSGSDTQRRNEAQKFASRNPFATERKADSGFFNL